MSYVDALTCGKVRRPHVIQKYEGADHTLLCMRQDASNTEAIKILRFTFQKYAHGRAFPVSIPSILKL